MNDHVRWWGARTTRSTVVPLGAGIDAGHPTASLGKMALEPCLIHPRALEALLSLVLLSKMRHFPLGYLRLTALGDIREHDR